MQSLKEACWVEGGGSYRTAEAAEGAAVQVYPAPCDSPIWTHYTQQALSTQLPVLIWESSEWLQSGLEGRGGTPPYALRLQVTMGRRL